MVGSARPIPPTPPHEPAPPRLHQVLSSILTRTHRPGKKIHIPRHRLRWRDLLILRLPSTKSVTAIDPTPLVIAIAKAHQRSDPALSEPKLHYLNCAVEDLPLSPSANNTSEPAGTDIITLFEVLEHIDLPSRFLKTTIPHLKPGGWLFGSTIARSPLSFLTTKVIAEAPLIGVVPRGTHDWNKYINPDELTDWFEKDGGGGKWAPKMQGVIYVPGLGWKMVSKARSTGYGNYFFGVQKLV